MAAARRPSALFLQLSFLAIAISTLEKQASHTPGRIPPCEDNTVARLLFVLRGGGGGGSGRKRKEQTDQLQRERKRPAQAWLDASARKRHSEGSTTDLAEAALKDGDVNLGLYLFNRSAHSDPTDSYSLSVAVWCVCVTCFWYGSMAGNLMLVDLCLRCSFCSSLA
jgi:hypothetical protein